jgi:hypothetical protein
MFSFCRDLEKANVVDMSLDLSFEVFKLFHAPLLSPSSQV